MNYCTPEIKRPFKETLLILASITLALILAGALPSAAEPYGDRILRLSEGKTLGLGQILSEVPPVQTRQFIDSTVADYLWLME